MAIKSKLKKTALYKKYIHCSYIQETMLWKNEYNLFLSEAKKIYQKGKTINGSLNDYKKALKKHRVTISEYLYKFEFWKLNQEERDEFISCSEMQCIYRKMIMPNVRNTFFNKVSFLNAFKSYIFREWILAKDTSFEEFSNFIQKHDCIAKPLEATRGHGIFKIQKNNISKIEELYKRCCNENMLIEECIHAHPEIEEFHSSSLNTIRVVTISNPDKCIIFGALLRMGAGGSFIDNTHSGGVFASINIETGELETDGIDSNGNHYEFHPDSKKKIKGFKIPYWEKVIKTCINATKVVPNTLFAGWDICVCANGNIEFIEGNHGPDFDGGMQAPKKIGVKKKVEKCVKELTGVNPLKFIPIFSETMNEYKYFDKTM